MKCPKCGGVHLMIETYAKVHIESDDSKDLYKIDDWDVVGLQGYSTEYYCIKCEHEWSVTNSLWD